MSTKPKQRRKGLRRVLLGLAVIVALLFAMMLAALHSETAFRHALRIAQPMIPGELSYREINGTLSGPIHATQVKYEIAGTQIRAARLVFDPSPFALLRGNVVLGDVEADALEIRLPPGDDEPDDSPARSPAEILDTLRLPVEIHARSLVVDRARLLDGQGNPLLELDRLELQLAWNADGIDIQSLQASGPELAASGDVMLGLDTGHRSRIRIEGEWREGPFPVRGEIQGEGDADTLALSARLHEPANFELDAELTNLLATPRWEGTIRFRDVRPMDIVETLPEEHWNGILEFRGTWRDTSFRTQATGSWPPANGIDLTAQGRVNAERLDITQLSARIGAFESRLEASGRINYSGDLLYSARGRFDAFTWPGQEPFTIRNGRFEAAGDRDRVDVSLYAAAGEHEQARLQANAVYRFETGTFAGQLDGNALVFDIDGHVIEIEDIVGNIEGLPENYRIDARLAGRYADFPSVQTRARATGNLDSIAIEVETLRWLEGTASGNATVDWRETLELVARIDGQGFQLKQLEPELEATLGGRVALNAVFGEQPDLRFDIESLQGDIAGRRLEGKGRVRLAEGRLSSPGLSISAGAAKLQLRDAPGTGFDFDIDVPDLQILPLPLEGRLQANGRFDGSLDAPDLDLEAQAENMAYEGNTIGALTLRASIRDGARSDSNVFLDMREVILPGFMANRLELQLEGDRPQHRLRLRMEEQTQGRTELALQGGWDDQRWEGRIERLVATHDQLGDWVLRERETDSRLTFTANGDVAFPRHCLRGPSGRACLGPFEKTEAQWRAQASLHQLPIGLFSVWLPPNLDYRGELGGEIDLAADAEGIRGNAEVRLGSGSIRQSEADDAISLLAWTQGITTVEFAGRTAIGELNLQLAEGGGISGQGQLDIVEEGPMRIDARLQAETDNLSLLPSLVPELSRLRGRFEADLAVTGNLDAPRIRGEARLLDGSARVLALGTDWRNVNATLIGEGRQIRMNARAESGEGHIEVELEGRETGDRFTGEAILRGENFKGIHTPEANVDISPDLRIRLDGRELFVGGEVRVPFARINPRDLSTATQPSPDQVIVNAEDRAREEGLLVNARVTTILGDDVRVEAFGLDARLDGRLTVTQQPDSPTTANGRLAVAEGQYRAYGQDLNLERGYVIYTGQQIGNPGLDIRATRRPTPDVTVGVTVRGPLAQPRLAVFSEPSMAETEALSYLLFGRSLTEATGAEAREIDNTAIALGLGGQRLLGRVGERIGVEEMRVEQIGDPDQAALVLGKYLSPDLYVSYGIGLYDAVNTFRIRYRLSSKWTMEATSGLKSSADFVYTIER